ncbi:MAG: hypothetical protein AAF360_13770 [Pseudomonadota bacterium]
MDLQEAFEGIDDALAEAQRITRQGASLDQSRDRIDAPPQSKRGEQQTVRQSCPGNEAVWGR